LRKGVPMRRRTVLSLAVGLLLSGVAAAQTVAIGLHQDPPNLDPILSQAFSDRSVTYQIFDRLVDIDENLNIVPLLATDWDVSDDGLVYTLQIREGVTFHDGTTLDAEAVRYTLERNLTREGSARRDELSSIADVSVTGPYTVQITLHSPNAAILAVLSGNAGAIVSPTAAEAAGADFGNQPVGSGPFVYHDRERQNHVTLRANPDYWNGAPTIQELVFRPFPDPDVRVANLLSGGVDIIIPIEPRHIASVQDASGYDVVGYDSLGWRALVMNLTRPPFDDPQVRLAVAQAIDRQALATVVYEDSVVPLIGPFPAGTPGYDPDLEAPAYDPEAARATLEAAGALGTEFTLLILPHEVLHGQFWQAILTQVGFNVQIEQMEAGPYLEVVNNLRHDATLVGWSGRIDPDPQFFPFVHTTGNLNWGGFNDERIDSLLEAARAETDPEAREGLYRDVARLVVEESMIVWGIQNQNIIGVSSRIEGIPLIPDGTVRWHGVTVR
jgi:peptide/nickel transport system substrate-binding protein